VTGPARPHPLAALWLAARPKTLVAGVAPVCVGTALAWRDGARALVPALLALVVSLGVQIGTNFFNDWADGVRGTDGGERLGPARATASGWLAPRSVLAASAGAFVVAALAGLALSALAGPWLIALGAVCIVAGLAYTGGPWPLAYLGLGEPFVIIFFGWVATAGTYFVQRRALAPYVLLLATALGLLAMALLVVNNLRDREGDALAHKRTLVVRLGARFGRREYAAALAGALLAVGAAAFVAHEPAWLVSFLLAPLMWHEGRAVSTRDGIDLNRSLGGTARLLAFLTGALCLGIAIGACAAVAKGNL